VKFLLEKYKVSTKILKDGRSVLHDATQNGYLKLLEYLLPFCDINVKNEEDGLTPLSLAVVSNAIQDEHRINLVNFLINRGANVNEKNKEGNTPLALSIMVNNEALIKLFIDDKTVNVNTIDKKEVPTLMIVILGDFENEKKIEIFKYFLDHRKEINLNEIKIHKGSTCLHLAAHFGCLELVDFLVQSTNLNLNDMDDAGNTVLHYVATSDKIQQERKIEILEYFWIKFDWKKIYIKGTTLLHECIFLGFFDVALYLLQTTCLNLNIKDSTGHTPIHTLLISDRLDERTKFDFLKLLVEKHDINISTLNQKKETFLHFCAQFGLQTILDFLIFEKKLIVDQKDCFGHTPLLSTIALSPMNNYQILGMVRYLVEKHGANIYIDLAMKLSLEKKNFGVYQYLLTQKKTDIRHPTPLTILDAMGNGKHKEFPTSWQRDETLSWNLEKMWSMEQTFYKKFEMHTKEKKENK